MMRLLHCLCHQRTQGSGLGTSYLLRCMIAHNGVSQNTAPSTGRRKEHFQVLREYPCLPRWDAVCLKQPHTQPPAIVQGGLCPPPRWPGVARHPPTP